MLFILKWLVRINYLFSKQFTFESVTKQDLCMSPHSVKPISSCDYRLHLKQNRKKFQFSVWVIQFIPSQCNSFFNVIVHVFSKLNFVVTGFTWLVVGNFIKWVVCLLSPNDGTLGLFSYFLNSNFLKMYKKSLRLSKAIGIVRPNKWTMNSFQIQIYH